MNKYAVIAQIIVAAAVIFVWVFRFDNIEKEFKQYGLNDQIRTLVGATKISLATLLIAGIWYPALVFIPAVIMGFLMIAAQYYHFKIHNPWNKHFPSLFLLLLCIFIALESQKIL